ncbi:hypothetical protein BFW38_06470 [Terasakiispira papahanaumokuakeensis]|uniref:Uncharacterized protein n=1 Tax=Terasakiispira papahanaumokuakeensis TaxID=197479 RepID=A0A1E2V896_9GAMM|nr:hypothetical protein [Terasakiispira papahanaumokuakeensis]ODC03239.1 hypothetical protein BFW38_06470 [Terasakiispira papahanaumokuakeensis]
MMSDAQFDAWLSRPNAKRVVLAELSHSQGVEYVANRPYISHADDEAPHRVYDDVLQGAIEINQRIDSKLELGALELVDDGSIAHWVDYRWRGYDVLIKLGAPEWRLDDFRVVARQINDGVINARQGKIQLGLYDVTASLAHEIQRPELPSGQLVPLILGQVVCAPATRVSTAELRYRVSWLPVTHMVVRDGNGPELSHAEQYDEGSFVADAYSPRSLMCDVIEPHDTPGKIVHWVAAHYGLSVAPHDLPDYICGLRYDGPVTGAQILDDVCQAIGGHWQIDIMGRLRVTVFELPDAANATQFDDDDVEQGQIALVETQEPLRSLTLQYARNYNPITEIAGSVDAVTASRLRDEFRSLADSRTLPEYPLAPDDTIETALQIEQDVASELGRRMALRAQRHDVWELKLVTAGLSDILGQSISVQCRGINGQCGRVISMRSSLLRERTTLEVWI